MPVTSFKNISLDDYTYYKVGGIAREAYFPVDCGEFAQAIRIIEDNKTPYFILGGGTNVLVGDGFWDGAVIITTRMTASRFRSMTVLARPTTTIVASDRSYARWILSSNKKSGQTDFDESVKAIFREAMGQKRKESVAEAVAGEEKTPEQDQRQQSLFGDGSD